MAEVVNILSSCIGCPKSNRIYTLYVCAETHIEFPLLTVKREARHVGGALQLGGILMEGYVGVGGIAIFYYLD